MNVINIFSNHLTHINDERNYFVLKKTIIGMLNFFCRNFLFIFVKMNFNNSISFKVDENCVTLKLVSTYMILLFATSTILNSLNLWIYYNNKLLKPINYSMIALLSFNLIGTILEAPPIIYNGFHCKYIALENRIENRKLLTKLFLELLRIKLNVFLMGL